MADPSGGGRPESLRDVLGGPAPGMAVRLLGAEVSHAGVTVRLTEVEAYAGPADPGSHAFRRTARSEVMYGPAGVLYCYLVYGMHVCANVVVGPDGEAGAVLLRAGTVVAGEELARARRPGVPRHRLARGPALLCRTLAIGLEANATDLASGPVRLRLPEQERHASGVLVGLPVSRGPRVGLRRAADVEWRFWVTEDASVSAYRPAPRRFDRPSSTR